MSVTRTRRGLAGAFAALVLAGPLAACGDDEPSNDTATDSQSATTDDPAGEEAAHGDAAGGSGSGDARHIEVGARSFAFEPDEITVGADEEIAVVLGSEDGAHDFTVDELGAQIVAEAGETGFGMFRTAEPGRYDFYCSVEGHREAGMEGVLVVEG